MRSHVTKAVHTLSLWSGLALRRAKAIRAPRILMYHGIHLDDVAPDLFAWQLRLLQDEFDLISLHELLLRLREARTTGHEVAITLDDGLRNHFTVAYPVLLASRV